MLFGNANDFAIEAMLEPGLKDPSAVWGRMCVRIGGTTLGDYDDHHCALYSAYRHFDWRIKQHGPLWDDIFDHMSPEEIYDTVHDALYRDDDRTIAQIQHDERRYGAFDFLTNCGEQFDGYSSVIVSPAPDSMLILHRPYANPDSSRRLPDEFVVAYCSRSGFVSTSAKFVDWYNREAERLSLK